MEKKNSNFILKGPIIVKWVRISSGHKLGRLVWSNISCIIISTLICAAWEAFTPIAASVGGDESTEVLVSTLLIGQASLSTEEISTPRKIINLGTQKNPPENNGRGYFWKVQQGNGFRGEIQESNGNNWNDAQSAQEEWANQTHQDMPLFLHINTRSRRGSKYTRVRIFSYRSVLRGHSNIPQSSKECSKVSSKKKWKGK